MLVLQGLNESFYVHSVTFQQIFLIYILFLSVWLLWDIFYTYCTVIIIAVTKSIFKGLCNRLSAIIPSLELLSKIANTCPINKDCKAIIFHLRKVSCGFKKSVCIHTLNNVVKITIPKYCPRTPRNPRRVGFSKPVSEAWLCH